MARVSAAAVAVLVVAFAAAAAAQESCNTELPGVLVGNYSGLNCQPVWNNFVLRVSGFSHRHCSCLFFSAHN